MNKYIHMFLYAVCCVFMGIFMLAMVGCRDSDYVAHPTKDKSEDEHYMKDARIVDNHSIGHRLYRVENDEVICYDSPNGLWCKWKQQLDPK